MLYFHAILLGGAKCGSKVRGAKKGSATYGCKVWGAKFGAQTIGAQNRQTLKCAVTAQNTRNKRTTA